MAVLFTAYYIIVYYVLGEKEQIATLLKDSLILFPTEFLGLQSSFSTIFPKLHNSGTWFVSCLIFCYFLYPLLKLISEGLKEGQKIILIVILWILLVYAAIIPQVYGIATIYTNILYRILEFTIGVLLFRLKIPNRIEGLLGNWWAFIIELVLLNASLFVGMELIGIPTDFMLYNWCAIPCFILMIITLSNLEENAFFKSRFLSYASGASYMFFFAQFFTWHPTRFVIKYLHLGDALYIKLSISLIFCIIITVLLHEFMEKPVKKIFQRILLEVK